MNPVHIIAVVLVVISAALPVMCLVKMRMNKRFREKAIVATAEILHVEKRHGQRSTYYIVQLRYFDAAGREYIGQTIFSSKNKVGAIIPVWYNATDPHLFKTDNGRWLRWGLAVSLLFVALVVWLATWLLNQQYSYRPG